jgi:hypothetical protein
MEKEYEERLRLASSLDTDPSVLKEIADNEYFNQSTNEEILEEIAANICTPNETLFLLLTEDYDFAEIARNTLELRDISYRDFEVLLHHENWHIRRGLALFTGTPPAILDAIAKYDDEEDGDLWILDNIAENPTTRLETLEYIVNEYCFELPCTAAELRVSVAGNPNCSIELLDTIVKLEWSRGVYPVLLNNLRLTPQMLDHIYEDCADWERDLVIQHPNFTSEKRLMLQHKRPLHWEFQIWT